MRAISVGYHDVEESDSNSENGARSTRYLYTLTPQQFRAHLQSISQTANVQTLDEAYQWGNQIPVFLTFDDGAMSALSCVAGELEIRGWHGHFFITSDWIGRKGFLNATHIRELHERGHIIGSHSCSHPARMSYLSPDELRREWGESCARLSDILGRAVKVASVPDGYYSSKVGRAAANAGIEVLFTSEATSTVVAMDRCLVLGRYFVQRHTPAKVSGDIAADAIWPRWQQTALWQTKKALKAVAGESYFSLRRRLLNLLSPLEP